MALLDLLGLGIKGAMAVGGLLAGKQQKDPEQVRIEEEYNRQAYGQLGRAKEANAMQSPGAVARTARGQITGTRDAAVSAALDAASANAANQGGVGIGGDASALVAAQSAAAPFAQAEAGITQGALSQEQQKTGQMAQIGDSIANLSNHVSYMNQEQQNPLLNMLSGLTAGSNAGNTVMNLLGDADKKLGDSTQNTESTADQVKKVLEGTTNPAGAVGAVAPVVAPVMANGIMPESNNPDTGFLDGVNLESVVPQQLQGLLPQKPALPGLNPKMMKKNVLNLGANQLLAGLRTFMR